MLFGVQHIVGDFPILEQTREVFGDLYRDRPHQDRTPNVMQGLDLLDDGVELALCVHIDRVFQVQPPEVTFVRGFVFVDRDVNVIVTVQNASKLHFL